MRKDLQALQHNYYTLRANSYDEAHVEIDDEHYTALKYVSMFASQSQVSNILDVGCGTGRAVRYLMEKNFAVTGIEPVAAMIEQAIERNGIPEEVMVTGSGEALPFPDCSFDAVCEFGVLHHVQRPDRVLSEMMRVARKAIFLSDENRFGMGSTPARLAKLLLCKAGVFKSFYYVKTLGKGYRYSEGDGIAYSYSIYDAYEALAEWADRIVLIPTANPIRKSWFHPLLNSTHALICALRE